MSTSSIVLQLATIIIIVYVLMKTTELVNEMEELKTLYKKNIATQESRKQYFKPVAHETIRLPMDFYEDYDEQEERGSRIGEERGSRIGEERDSRIGEERDSRIEEERGSRIDEERGSRIDEGWNDKEESRGDDDEEDDDEDRDSKSDISKE
jgi:hypothetical protein